MTTLTVTSKGQVTLRRDLLDHLGVKPGDKISIDKLPEGRVQVSAARGSGNIADAFGILGPTGLPAPTIEEINEAIAAGWAGEP